jgi:hypothetical protein
MEEEHLLSQLTSDDPADIKKGISELQQKMYKNNGILVVQNLAKFKNSLLAIFQNSQSYHESEVMPTLFEFLAHFLSNNFSWDYEIQLTTHILPDLINSWMFLEDRVLELAKQALDAYIRSYKQLEIVINYLLKNVLNDQDSSVVLKGIKLAVENIEYHPKIISAESREFITFIEQLWVLRANKDSELSSHSRNVIMDFLKRFPATMNEIANEMESRDKDDLSKLIKLRNETIQYK